MKKLTAVLSVFLLVGFTSCKKYEEGPSFSLRSKKARVANSWIVDEYVYTDGEIFKANNSPIYEFEKDGDLRISYPYGEDRGSWEFRNSKESIAFIIDGFVDVYAIVKLKEKELWLADELKDEIHFIPAN